MLWVYGHYKYCYSYSAGIDFRRQNLTSTDVKFCKGSYRFNQIKIGGGGGREITQQTKYLYNIYTMLNQRRRRWAVVV